MARRIENTHWLLLVGVFALYAIPYLILTSRGRYVPAAVGRGYTKTYRWSPAGFEERGRLKQIFYPLRYLDNRFWHVEMARGEIDEKWLTGEEK